MCYISGFLLKYKTVIGQNWFIPQRSFNSSSNRRELSALERTRHHLFYLYWIWVAFRNLLDQQNAQEVTYGTTSTAGLEVALQLLLSTLEHSLLESRVPTEKAQLQGEALQPKMPCGKRGGPRAPRPQTEEWRSHCGRGFSGTKCPKIHDGGSETNDPCMPIPNARLTKLWTKSNSFS